MTEPASVLAMRQLVAEAGRSSGRPRSRRQALERLTALRERRTALDPGEGEPGTVTGARTTTTREGVPS